MELTFDGTPERMPGWQIPAAVAAYLRGFCEGQHAGAPRLSTAQRASNVVLTRAAQPPMGSTPDDGSDALLQQAIADYLVRVPAFAFGALLEIAGRQLPMGGAIPKIPARVGTVAPGKFVGDASPIPVLSGSITGLTLPSTKCAAIMVATRELSKAAGGLSVIESMLDESCLLYTSDAADE